MDLKKIISNKKDYYESCKTKEKLIVHHIDGNFANHDTKNLKTLCKSCHFNLHMSKGYPNLKIKAYTITMHLNKKEHDFIRKNKYSATGIFYEALKMLGYKEQ